MAVASAGRAERAVALARRSFGLLIDGNICSAINGDTFAAVNPANGRHLADVPFAGQADVARAVEAAAAAAPSWRATSLVERIECIRNVITILAEHAEDLALLDCVDGGLPYREALKDLALAQQFLNYQASVAFEIKGQTLPSMTKNWLLTKREPYGVVGRIGAFNHPLMFTAAKLGAPLAMGNTLVIKIPEQASLSSLAFGELIRATFPPGVVNIIAGDGATTGGALVRHPIVKRLALIGSIPTAQRIARSAADVGIKHLSFELGGKNAMIVCPDADLERAADSAALGTAMRASTGQSCGSITRLYVHESIHAAFLERVVERLRTLRCGDPLDDTSDVGPVVSAEQFERVMLMIERGKAEGARLVLGGVRPRGLENGNFVAPTVFSDVSSDMAIAREEVFGPVLSILKWRDATDVVAEANASSMGLTAAVWTRDLGTAMEFADALDTGYVWINGSAAHFLGAPFSGHKNSGTDVEESIEELYSYTQMKTVSIAW